MSGNDTHADTIRAFPSVEECDAAIVNPQWVLDHPGEYDIEARVSADKDVRRWARFREYAVALGALVAELDEWKNTARAESDGLIKMREQRDRERARADRAEAALKEIAEHRTYGSDLGMPDHGQKIARAALSAGSGGRETRPEGHEGMVTVYDHSGGYLGCMGRETWKKAVADEAQRRKTSP